MNRVNKFNIKDKIYFLPNMNIEELEILQGEITGVKVVGISKKLVYEIYCEKYEHRFDKSDRYSMVEEKFISEDKKTLEENIISLVRGKLQKS